MHRRNLLRASLALPVLGLSWPMEKAMASAEGATAASETATGGEDGATPFEAAQVRDLARRLAAAAFKRGDATLPDPFAAMKYDAYRSIRFVPDKALWRTDKRLFQAQLFHRGFLYKERVDIYEVANGEARRVPYSSEMFTVADLPMKPAGDLGFAGFRLHTPMNRPDYFDEVCAFLGASYFRAVAKNQIYGISARGLALKTADKGGEEFPGFRAFWLERPAPGNSSIVVHALLDSESATAAYRFSIRPGESTVFDVAMALYPRVEITQAGIAPLTSMFYFDAHDRDGIDDFRPAVHDSDGLAIKTGQDEQLWRPLTNPKALQVSAFSDNNPRGFGLLQRDRRFTTYEDLEARYERRPSLWVEPIGDWGEGEVFLVEIPTQGEIHDNIVSFWRPRAPLRAKTEYLFNYRLHWCAEPPDRRPLAVVQKTRMGSSWNRDRRLAVIDIEGEALKGVPPDARVVAEVTADKGGIENVVAQPNPETGGWRISFELPVKPNPVVELRARLMGEQGVLSETWLFRWTP